ncbi:MAG: GIY-YIG nuclease family protein [Candidatus Pacebacteria bacterium]|nr:GIY-YIG nuclease family protein [Candidatus Paceibacterota bacterium]MBP9840277.1 GIY-YIG nuclease family protein [Candidatus Paceibacterota bacterium]
MADFFPPRPEAKPTIYAYKLKGVETHAHLLKVGYTTRDAQSRIAEQLTTARLQYEIVFEEPAMRADGSTFTDTDVHRHLRGKRITNPEGEWFECGVKDVRAAYVAIREGVFNEENRTQTFGMRPEQADAVVKTAAYFTEAHADGKQTPHFLWNAKMRFGKTFTTYQLAKKMGWRRVLVLTFKPAVHNSWHEDLMNHVDFEGWQFVSRRGNTLNHADIDEKKPFVVFGSFQDFLGKNSAGGIKAKNEWVHETTWDAVVFDEYHYGAWRESAKDLFVGEEKDVRKDEEGEALEYFDERAVPIKTGAYLYLSGTPFRAIASGEFIEEQIFNWTYSDEQRAKEEWDSAKGPNPYASLPRMVMLTYQLPDAIREVAMGGEFNQFDLSQFFAAEGKGKSAKFLYKDEVQKWLDLIRGAFAETTVDNLKLGAKKPALPFSDTRLLNVLSHTFWFLPSVAACHAMANLLKQRQNKFFNEYEVIVAAGTAAGIGVAALEPVLRKMGEPLKTRTITLSCGKLTTGVSVKPWTGIFMLRNVASPETYFQAAFRVQTPWTVPNPEGNAPNREEIIKQECYVFDFAPDRALRQIAEYSSRLNLDDSVSPEKKVEEFIHFLPVLAYDGSAMNQIDAAGILDMAMSGTTATLLARRWESALLVNVDNYTLARLMNSDEAMQALMSIEGFRALNQDIETIINKSGVVEKLKKEANDRTLTKKETESLSDAEKELKGKRKQVQEKLIKFATRIPVFMYLTDYREHTLKDVINELEPDLFKRVTGLTKKDFELLVSLGVFNDSLMNDAVYKFRRYEDASLAYTGINRHEGENVGLFSTVLSVKEYDQTFINTPEE